MTNLAPIALFVYNRPWHTQKVLESLSKNEEAKNSTLYVFADGAKLNNIDTELINEVSNVIKKFNHCFKKIVIKKQSQNMGLSKSIITGINEVFINYNKIIVLEDDIVVSSCFLNFMNSGLNLYQNESRVATIQGYQFPISFKIKNSTYFDIAVGCWGWATWKNRWILFEEDGKKLKNRIENAKLWSDFDIKNTYPFKELLENQIKGNNDSWAVRWYASLFLNNKLNLYSTMSLTKNIGNDGSGNHGDKKDVSHYPIANNIAIDLIRIELNIKAQKQVYFYRLKQKLKLKTSNLFIKFKVNILKLN